MASTIHRTSVFEMMGYEILNYRGGAYHLRSHWNGHLAFEGVGLLYSSTPISEADTIEFFELDGRNLKTGTPPPSNQLEQMLNHWTAVDARRLGESGLYSVQVKLADFKAAWAGQEMLSIPRTMEPDRLRYYAMLDTGDLVCFN